MAKKLQFKVTISDRKNQSWVEVGRTYVVTEEQSKRFAELYADIQKNPENHILPEAFGIFTEEPYDNKEYPLVKTMKAWDDKTIWRYTDAFHVGVVDDETGEQINGFSWC